MNTNFHHHFGPYNQYNPSKDNMVDKNGFDLNKNLK